MAHGRGHEREVGARPAGRVPIPADDELAPQALSHYLAGQAGHTSHTGRGGEPAGPVPGRSPDGEGRAELARAALTERSASQLQRTAGNAALHRALGGTGHTGAGGPGPAVQRQAAAPLQPDLLDALMLEDWPRAVTLLEGLGDAALATRVGQESPERLLHLQRAATRAGAARVVQAIRNLQIRSGTQVADIEGTTFRTPVTLFRSGVVMSRDMRFVKRGRFRSDADFVALKNRVIDAVRTRLTARFRLKIETPGGAPAQPGDGEYTIRVVVIDNPSATYRMNLHGRRNGRASVNTNSGTIFELGPPGDTAVSEASMAHECAHVLLGAHDEYADAAFPARQLFADHSLMGNFYSEGRDQAELKARHFGDLVRLVSGWFPGRTVSIVQ